MPDTIDDAQEHPIIFNEWSINRILAGEKTQTRRIVKPQPPENADKMEVGQKSPHGYPGGEYGYHNRDGKAVYGMPCPYGQPGDLLWVREAFRLPLSHEKFSPNEWLDFSPARNRKYVADGEHQYRISPIADSEDCWGRKRPSTHMPRELSRIRLRVEDVRVERVQKISQKDAKAEGFERTKRAETEDVFSGRKMVFYDAPTLHFQHKWNDIRGDGAWERNDWVWVITFSRIDNA
jgi:hypothetical protein